MITDLIITDDFYQNVDSVREFALNQPFDVKGNYPGQRTKTFHEWPGLKDGIQQIVKQININYSRVLIKDLFVDNMFSETIEAINIDQVKNKLIILNKRSNVLSHD